MVGLIWTIQLVHYPLFSRIEPGRFAAYEAGHTNRMGRLLALPATTEVVTGALLVWHRPPTVPLWLVILAGGILALTWIVTLLVQVPIHAKLAGGFDAATISRLIRLNWVRTAAWTLRGLLMLTMVANQT